MLVKRKLVNLSLNNKVNLRMVETTTTIAISLATTIVMVRKEGILTISSLITIKGHGRTMDIIGRVM